MTTGSQPNWDAIAEKFDLWLPHIAPVGAALLDVLQAETGDKILDLASGTGEPALTLARQQPGVNIVGVDAAEGMVRTARNKVERERLANIRFQTMPAERLEFTDESFDKVLCRFGIMLFADPQQGVNEMARVLKTGGRYAFTVWGTAETMTTMYWARQVFKGRIAEELAPALEKVTSLGPPGVIEEMLNRAGLTRFQVSRKRFNYEFQSFDDYWNLIEASDILRQQFEALPTDQCDLIRDEVARFARDFQTPEGLKIPHEYVLVWGDK
ncbi:MAG: methyltransferase domain-containing protein [Gammaproteobacteria bacterium]|nr:methyltransferase domain-containing protein [Gammaproteobacteria bacterium]